MGRRDPDDVLDDMRDMLAEMENDDTWLDDEETDADDDTPLLDNPHDGLEWDDDEEDDE